jgi:RimJ/RimL family protein N-acetyltransferase
MAARHGATGDGRTAAPGGRTVDDVLIRPVDLERDGPGSVALFREANPWFVSRVDAWLWWQERIPERARYRSWTAEVDGEVVGRAEAGVNWWGGEDASAFAGVLVREAWQGRGLGTRLAELAEGHAASLGRPRILANFLEADDAVRFARARGYEQLRAETLSAVDPRGVDVSALDRTSSEIAVVAAPEVPAEALWRIDVEASVDVPLSDPMGEMPFDEWLTFWDSPRTAKEGSFAVLDEGRVVAATLISADFESGRAVNNFTGTLRSHRGRGLATLAKLASINWAARNGIVSITTTNDERNAGMLAINRKLGYEPVGRVVEYGRDL